ncbi:MAG: ATP-binding protein [Flammeovirgaceae bacterium]
MLKNLLNIGIRPETSKAEKEYHTFIIVMGSLTSLGALLWSILGWICDLGDLALLPLVYVSFTVLNFTQFYFFKNFQTTRFFQVSVSLILPFAFQWYLGGFAASGMMMIWAVISLTGAMTYKNLHSVMWLIFFTLLVIYSGFENGNFQSDVHSIPPEYTDLFFSFNMSVLSIITFTLFFGTKLKLEIAVKKENQRKQELAESQQKLQHAHNELLSSEEEIRQNAEELKTINEHLEIIQNDLHEALQNEQIGRKELEKAHKELQHTQAHLLQSEKMASLGQMTAGVAHEINNPINFVSGGVQTLKEIISDLMNFVEACEKMVGADAEALKTRIQELSLLKEELVLDELKEDTIGLLDDIELGASRATEIVKGLRNFSRLDQDVFKKGDIHEGMESTLLILRNRFGSITLVKNYDTSIPKIDCNLGELNQVFMNLIGNALDATEDEGEIGITTQNLANTIVIKITDTGMGIPEAVKSRIFEPFFTTKDVGEGTGLGLSISYGIIQKHKGTLSVESEVGKGTAFIITLPKNTE